ncbi:putative LacI family transcriptional regulator [Tetragenococcus halophilus subsp. halophilus]|nr:putative LacI family transcriptional regulator [Tetragenococcus halophilus subsp. halophilus]GBD80098.1 putative LacI family transcriptional regulator [Tetragenococcus halophilus subsp. halophilus]
MNLVAGIRDVARRAGVSATTVSRVLNNDTTLSVGNKTKEKIYQAVQELNYDISKRKYVKKRYPSIGVIATISRQSEIDDPYFSDLRSGMEEEARRLHLGMNRVYNLSDNPKAWHDLDKLGAIIVIGTVDEKSVQKLKEQNSQVIIVDNPDIQTEADLVYADFERMTKYILRLFVEAGHRDIAYIGGYNIDIDEKGTKSFNENEKRLRTYRQFMQEQGLNIRYKLGNWEPLEGKRMTDELLAEGKNFPTALLVGSDPLSVGVYRSLQTAERKVGSEVAIASFDDIEIAEFLTPNLTTVAINASEIGRVAVRLAKERIDHIRDEPVVMTFPSKLIVRESFIPS